MAGLCAIALGCGDGEHHATMIGVAFEDGGVGGDDGRARQLTMRDLDRSGGWVRAVGTRREVVRFSSDGRYVADVRRARRGRTEYQSLFGQALLEGDRLSLIGVRKNRPVQMEGDFVVAVADGSLTLVGGDGERRYAAAALEAAEHGGDGPGLAGCFEGEAFTPVAR